MSEVPAFRLKQVTFFQRPVMILCQNKNGPCPLIAITNILLLKGRLTISTDLSYISLEEIVQMVAEIIFEENERLRKSHSTDVIQQTFDDILTILPKLAKGLDLNVCFHGVNKFEFTQEISIFDTLQIPLLHGWLYDVHIDELDSILGDKSYNHLIYKLVDYKSLVERINTQARDNHVSVENIVETTLSSEEQELYQQGIIIDHYFNESASQLTEVGLLKLYEFMQDRQLAVFFRNNHFSTVFSYNGQLFLLVTDLGYYDQEAIVWELLMNVNGSSDFYTSNFDPVADYMIREQSLETPRGKPAVEGTVALPPAAIISETESPMHQLAQSTSKNPVVSSSVPSGSNAVVEVDADMLLAMQLQMEEEKLQAEETRVHHQQQYQPQFQPSPAPNSNRLPATPHAPPATITQLVEGNQNLGLTQEEMDQQLALMLHYQEVRENQQSVSHGNSRPQSAVSQQQQQQQYQQRNPQQPQYSDRSQVQQSGSNRSPRNETPRNEPNNSATTGKSGTCIIQ